MAALVETYDADVVMPPVGMVPLSEKLIPVCKMDKFPEHLAYIRATVDVEGFRNKLRNLPVGFWEDENQVGNVRMQRPAHDAWGVKKIVFTFCDDYMLKILDLPYAQSPEWRQFLLPIYQAIGIEERQVVRSLLANMPGGLAIPTHHDTGYWVKHCHRCHVALETGPRVSFTVGPTEDAMRKHAFPIGKVVELNNQAKHAVYNEMDSNRIHLIFDYVELEYLDAHPEMRRVALKANEKIVQTRRSLDLAADFGKRKTPTFMVIGSQKCGTTSIYEYLMQHGLAVKGQRRETHFFDWRWPEINGSTAINSEEHFKKYMEYYPYEGLQKHPSLFTGESTPSYLLHSDIVIPRIKAVVPWVKLICIFRNPVDRAFSQFQMTTDMSGSEEQLKVRGQSEYLGRSFESIIEDEIRELENAGISSNSTYEQFRDNYLKTRPMGHGGHSIIGRGLYALQLLPWLESFSEDQLMVLELGDIKGGAEKVNATMHKVLKFLGLPEHDVEDATAKNTRSYEKMSQACRDRLNAFYAPYNERLYAMLGRNFGW